MESIGRGVPDTPLEPAIGLAEGETRWRSMKGLAGASFLPPAWKGEGATVAKVATGRPPFPA